MSKPWQNNSGCNDPTAYKAIQNISAEKKRIDTVIKIFRLVAELAGLRITSWIEFEDIETGDRY